MKEKTTFRSPLLRTLTLMVLSLLLLTSCYQSHRHVPHAAFQFSERQIDSLSFFSTHHYTNNYNFVVRADSMQLLSQLPEEKITGMQTDSFAVHRDDHLVVADIRMVPKDSIDSVWVQLGNDESRFGWIHESEMLPKVMPDDPISQFISSFSDSHVILFLIVIAIIAACYTFFSIFRHKAHIVHFHDIDSFYPTLLCLIVASSATLYASIQMFWPQMWQHFYFHPTLNPFSVPTVLCIFLLSVWAMIIVAIAVVDDVRRMLSLGETLLYLGGLVAMCAIDYIAFSITTLYYVGYILLIAYYVMALHIYFTRHWATYYCGYCGAKLHHKGRCPHCGAMNE